jgi:hypothetical protein
MSWPPVLADLKSDLKIDSTDTRDDARLQAVLDAAVVVVARVRAGAYLFDQTDIAQFGLPLPTADIILGTLRLAGRWHERRRSPDGLVDMADLGSARVPSFDPDIDRLLGIGRFAGPVFA